MPNNNLRLAGYDKQMVEYMEKHFHRCIIRPMHQISKTQQTKEWEEAYLDTRRNFKTRKKRLLRFGITSKDSVLDLGCGDGLSVSILIKMGIKRVVGVDISKYLIEKAKKNNPGVKFYLGKAESLPFRAKQFDVVLVDSVFHHLYNYSKAIKEIKRVLVSGGLLCFIEPHQSFLRRVLDLLCVLPVSKVLPVLRKRRITYLEEKDLMNHWLLTEHLFYKTLIKQKFKMIFQKQDFLSIVGKYKNIS